MRIKNTFNVLGIYTAVAIFLAAIFMSAAGTILAPRAALAATPTAKWTSSKTISASGFTQFPDGTVFDNPTVQGNNITLIGGMEGCGMTTYNDKIVVYNYTSTSPAQATVSTGPCDGTQINLTMGNAYPAGTQPKASWVDQLTVSYLTETFTKQSISGTDMTLTASAGSCGMSASTDTLVVHQYNSSTPPTATLTTGCNGQTQTVGFSNTFGGVTQPKASWVDQSTVSYRGETFTQQSISGTDMTLTASAGSCGMSASTDTLVVHQYNSSTPPTATLTTGCNGQTQTVGFSNTFGGVPAGTGGPTSGNGPADNCPIDQSSALRWVLCPVFDIGMVALSWLTSAVNNFLYTPTAQIFGSTGNVKVGSGPTAVSEAPDLQSAFNAFRNIALGFLVIAGLVMVIAQAANLEIFAAYTVRKALPRIVVAAIGISLAWPILQFAVTFFDDLGVWIGTIIITVTHVSGVSGGGGLQATYDGVLAAVLSGFAVAGAFVVMGAGGILPLIGTLLLAALVGLIVLAVRQLVILMCIILAPLAIAASVLPSTSKLWDFWQDTLTGALLMYPLIMGFLSAGVAMAGIAGAAGAAQRAVSGGTGVTWDLLALLAYFAPLFFLPFMFKIAGGLMGGVHSMVNGKFQGGFKRLSEQHQEATAINKQKLLEGRRKFLPSSINAAGSKVGAFLNTEDKLGYLRNKGDAREIAESRWGNIVKGKYAHEDGAGATMYWDDMLHAQKYGNAAEAQQKLGLEREWFETEKGQYGEEIYKYKDAAGNEQRAVKDDKGKYRRAIQNGDGKYVVDERATDEIDKRRMNINTGRVNKAIQQAQAQGGFGFAQRQYAIDQLAANGTGYRDMADALNSIAIASNGNEEVMSNMVGGVRSLTERAGRLDVKGDFDKMLGIASDISKTGGIDSNIATRIQSQTVKAVRSVDNATLVRQKPAAINNAVKALTDELDRQMQIHNDANATQTAKQDASEQIGQIRVKLENMAGSADYGYGSEVNQGAINRVYRSDTHENRVQEMNAFMQPVDVQRTNPMGQPQQVGTPQSAQTQAQQRAQQAPQVQTGQGPAPMPQDAPIWLPQRYRDQQAIAQLQAQQAQRNAQPQDPIAARSYTNERQRAMQQRDQGDRNYPAPPSDDN